MSRKNGISKLDLLIYRLFLWRWEKHFRRDPGIRGIFQTHLKEFDRREAASRSNLYITPPPPES